MLISASGPHAASLKIRPPLPITTDQIDRALSTLDKTLHSVEDGSRLRRARAAGVDERSSSSAGADEAVAVRGPLDRVETRRRLWARWSRLLSSRLRRRGSVVSASC